MKTTDLMVTRGRDQGSVVVVNFFRLGTGFFPCLIAKKVARNDDYLRSIVSFMQNKVPVVR
jgi:hypothetical protein